MSVALFCYILDVMLCYVMLCYVMLCVKKKKKMLIKKKFRATGFTSAKVTATEIALELEVEPKFRIKRDKRKAKDTDISPEKKFETD